MIALYLAPFIVQIKKGIWGIVKQLAELAAEHVMVDLKMMDDAEHTMQFTMMWGKTSNPYHPWDPQRNYLQIEIKACLDFAVVFPVIKPPFHVNACFAGLVRLMSGSSCPGIQTLLVGRSTITFEIGFDFWYVGTFNIGSVELGIESGMDWNTPRWCWWYHNPNWGKNDSWWVWRRRRQRICQTGKTTCAIYVKGWIAIRVWIAKVIVELKWWMMAGTVEIFLRFKIQTIWALYWEWWEVWGKKIATFDSR